MKIFEPLASAPDRYRAIQELVEHWHGPRQPEFGFPDAALGSPSLPAPLAWWYRFAGRWPRVLTRTNKFFGPAELWSAEGKIHFYSENQGVYEWATVAEGDDPPVWGRYSDEKDWVREAESLSGVLLQICILETIWGAADGADGYFADSSLLQRFLGGLSPVAVGPLRWPENPSHLYGSPDLLALFSPNSARSGEHYVAIGVKSAATMEKLEKTFPEVWDRYPSLEDRSAP